MPLGTICALSGISRRNPQIKVLGLIKGELQSKESRVRKHKTGRARNLLLKVCHQPSPALVRGLFLNHIAKLFSSLSPE